VVQQQGLPSGVRDDEENGIDANGMDYSKLTPLLVEAVKALRAEKDAEIKEQEATIARQQAAIAELLRRVEELERRGAG
jgi:hypothetical protein